MDLKNLMRIRGSIYGTPKQSYFDDFVAINEMAWENAPNVFSSNDEDHYRVQYETEYGEKTFQFVDARVDSVFNPSTGKNLGDDFKLFVFKPDAPKIYFGELFYWVGNYWLCINENAYESISNGGIVRRCNNVLKWVDDLGRIQIEPCVISYDIQQANDYPGKILDMTSGFTRIQCQKNRATDFIKPNMRFLFGLPGNWKCYKVTGGGVRNYLNSETTDNFSRSVIELWVANDYWSNKTDDIENGIADAFINQFTITIDQSYLTQSVGFETQLTATIKRNDVLTDMPIRWKSSNETVATVDELGALKCIGLGAATITAFMDDNCVVSDTLSVSVVEDVIEEFEIRITPNDTYVLQGQTQVFECWLYKNGIKQDDKFDFVDDTVGIPFTHYNFRIVDDNHFSIYNKIKYIGTQVLVTCIVGDEQKTFGFDLKGAY